MNVYKVGSETGTGAIKIPPVKASDCSVETYQHSNYRGTRDVYRGAVTLVKHNDQMSSMKLPPGCCVTIYEHSNFRGRQQRYCRCTSFVGQAWNDKMSSLKVSSVSQPIPGIEKKPA